MSEMQKNESTPETTPPGGDGDGQFHVSRLLWFLVMAAVIVIAAVIFESRM